jgi:uracil-DNA glycosylase family 4
MPTRGFFTDEQIEKGTQRYVDLDDTGPHCKDCGLFRKCKSPRMKYTGDGRLKVLAIGEAPGGEEDQLGKQFVKHAQAGGYLWKELSLHDIDLDRDFWKVNAVNCRPMTTGKFGKIKNRTPEKSELRYCRPIVEQTIRELQPRFILLMGTKAVESFYLDHFKESAISRWRGLAIPDQRYNCWVLPLFHPSYITRDSNNENLTSQYSRDITHAVEIIQQSDEYDVPAKRHDYNKRVMPLFNYGDVIKMLDTILKQLPPRLEIDFETTGLKPFRPGHKILSISMCYNENLAFSFPFQYRNHWNRKEFIEIKRRVRKVLIHQAISKEAHNMKFEDVWASEIIGVQVENWGWDSMIAAHIIDNRQKFSGLKFQTYINFGFYPYDKPVQRYIKGFPFNKMEKCPLDDLLPYGGLDSLFGFMLKPRQKREIERRGLTYPYDFFHEGAIVLADIEKRGVCTDEEYYHKQSNKEGTGVIDRKIIDLLKVTMFGEDADKFKKQTGREIDLESPKDLGILLYDILEYPPILTDKGNRSVDEKALNKIRLPFVKDLLALRKMIKVKGTYLAQFKRFSYNGVMHPSYDLTIPKSYRGSSSDPNFQNIPKRDEFSMNTCRKGIIPRKGHGLLSSDFSGIEVAISACYNKDPELIKYITDPTTDMHRDAASDIWKLPQEEVTKQIRYSGKNGWVFPQFYGSYYKNCAPDLWDNYLDLETASGITLKKHMAKQGIKTVADFVGHCKTVEDKFWGKRFRVYKKWKDAINEEYRKNGYISTYLGFQFTGYMTRNECTNYQTQGTAFHMLLWTLIEVEKVAAEEDWESYIIGQINDDMIHDYVDEELNHIVETINYVGTEKIKEMFPWISVPLEIEHEISGIDGNWAEMKEYKCGG